MFTFVFHLQVQMQPTFLFIDRSTVPFICHLLLSNGLLTKTKRKQNTNLTEVHFRVLKLLKNIKPSCNYCVLHIPKPIFLFLVLFLFIYILAHFTKVPKQTAWVVTSHCFIFAELHILILFRTKKWLVRG